MKSALIVFLAFGLLAASATSTWARQPKGQKQQTTEEKQPQIAEPSTFDPEAAVQEFTASSTGGVQRVTARESSDAKQIGLIRETLKKAATDFAGSHSRDAPEARGQSAASLAVLLAAGPGQLRSAFVEVRGGAEIRYSSDDPQLVAALHEWFLRRTTEPRPDAAANPNQLISMPKSPPH
jgi:hypothetical protein